MTTAENFKKELNEVLNKVARYGNLVELMEEHPPKDKNELEMAKTLFSAYDAACTIIMKLERKMNQG